MSGLPPHKRKRRKLIVFQAFLDDSGHVAPVFVLSGYISPVYWWKDFSAEWQGLLDEIPKLKYFKMREAAGLCGQFSGFKVNARNERLKKFLNLIWKASHESISCVIPLGPYKRIMKGNINPLWD